MIGQLDAFKGRIFWDTLDRWLARKTDGIGHFTTEWRKRPPLQVDIPMKQFRKIRRRVSSGTQLARYIGFLPTCLVVTEAE